MNVRGNETDGCVFIQEKLEGFPTGKWRAISSDKRACTYDMYMRVRICDVPILLASSAIATTVRRAPVTAPRAAIRLDA